MAYQGIDAVWMRWFIPGSAMLLTEAEAAQQRAERPSNAPSGWRNGCDSWAWTRIRQKVSGPFCEGGCIQQE